MREPVTAIGKSLCGWGVCMVLAGCTVAPAPDNGNGDGNGGPQSTLAVFNDPDSDFTTTEVHDVDNQIVRFNTENDSIVWGETGAEYEAGQWAVNGNFPESSMFFQVRFGTVDGERRAYFTETGPATICDIRVSGAFLQIFATNVLVPQEE